MKKFDINKRVKIKLTDYGIEVCQKFNGGTLPKLDENGYYEDQLWVIIWIFGGDDLIWSIDVSTTPFESTEMLIDEADLEDV